MSEVRTFSPQRSRPRIGIMGTPLSSGNRGVQALGESLVRLCSIAVPNAEFVYFGSHRDGKPVNMRPDGKDVLVRVSRWRLNFEDGLRYHLGWILLMALFYRSVPLRAIRRWIAKSTPWIEDLETCEVVGDIRGGDSFSDIYGLERFMVASLASWTVILVRGSIIHFPQTYGPFQTRRARWIAAFLLRRSRAVIARDEESQRIAQELVGSRINVQLSPDVAFALYAGSPPSLEIAPAGCKKIFPNTIGLNVNGLMYSGGYDRGNMFGLQLDYVPFLRSLVLRLLKDVSLNVLLVPHTFAAPGNVESDNGACWSLRESLPEDLRNRVQVVVGDYDCHELKWIIGQCDFFIGSRMHSCIAALSQAVPCVGVAYSMKFKGVFGSVGVAHSVVDARGVTEAQAIETIECLYISRAGSRNELETRLTTVRQSLNTAFSLLLIDLRNDYER